MNTDEVMRSKFEKLEQVDVMWDGDIKYSSERNEYYCSRSYFTRDANDLTQRWQGYQQATKDIIDKLKNKQSQLKLAKASTYHNEMGRLVHELTGVHYSAYKEKQQALKEAKHGN